MSTRKLFYRPVFSDRPAGILLSIESSPTGDRQALWDSNETARDVAATVAMLASPRPVAVVVEGIGEGEAGPPWTVNAWFQWPSEELRARWVAAPAASAERLLIELDAVRGIGVGFALPVLRPVPDP